MLAQCLADGQHVFRGRATIIDEASTETSTSDLRTTIGETIHVECHFECHCAGKTENRRE